MSLRLSAIALLLRLVEKPRLARARNVARLRAGFEAAARAFATPAGARAEPARLGAIPALRVAAAEPTGRRVLYLHGGAFLVGSPRTHWRLAAALARAAGAEAVLPAYRLAPEHPHPAAVDDALAAWAALLADGADPARTAVAGDSAGGGLAFALVVAARAAGLPDPACVVAFSPWADMTLSGGSWVANARRDCMIPAERSREVARLRLAGADPRDPLASPVFARFDRPPPPALIAASRSEVLADDAAAMAAALRAAGGAVETLWEANAPHAWPIFAGLAPEADAAVAAAGAFVRRFTPERRDP